jgi:hypothetical protein
VLHRIDLAKSLRYPSIRIVFRNMMLRQDIASLVVFTGLYVNVVGQVLLFIAIVFNHFLAFARLDFMQIVNGLHSDC